MEHFLIIMKYSVTYSELAQVKRRHFIGPFAWAAVSLDVKMLRESCRSAEVVTMGMSPRKARYLPCAAQRQWLGVISLFPFGVAFLEWVSPVTECSGPWHFSSLKVWLVFHSYPDWSHPPRRLWWAPGQEGPQFSALEPAASPSPCSFSPRMAHRTCVTGDQSVAVRSFWSSRYRRHLVFFLRWYECFSETLNFESQIHRKLQRKLYREVLPARHPFPLVGDVLCNCNTAPKSGRWRNVCVVVYHLTTP